MGALFYVIRRSIVNFIKNFKKKPSKILPYIYIVAMMIFIFAGKKNHNKIMQPVSVDKIITFITLAMIVIFFFSIIAATEKRKTQFLMSDVNMGFTSPIRPQNLLIYEFIKSISSMGLFVLVMFYQIPNIQNMLQISMQKIVFLLLPLVLFFITLSTLSILIFSICSVNKNARKLINGISKSLGGVIGLYVIINIFINKSHWFETFIKMFSNKALDYIPIIGWHKALFYKCITEINIMFFVYLMLSLAFIGLIIWVLYNMNLDYYEDVLAGAEDRENLLKMKTKQIKAIDYRGKFKMKTRKVSSEYNATFGKAIFYKHLLELKKTGFGIFNLYTVFLIIIGGGYGFVAQNSGTIFPLLVICVYLSLIGSFNNKIHVELTKQYIFLIPDSEESKIFWATLTSSFKSLVDGTIVFLIAGVLVKANAIMLISTILTYVSFQFVFIYGGVLSYRLFGKWASKGLRGILMLVSVIMYVLPGIIAATIIAMKLHFLGQYAINISMIIWNIVVSLIIIQFAKGILNHCELE